MNNGPLVAACLLSVAGCVGAAYLVDRFSPVPPTVPGIVEPAGAEDPKDIYSMYRAKTTSLDGALKLLAAKGTDEGIRQVYAKSDDAEFRAALEKYYPGLAPSTPESPPPPESPPLESTPESSPDLPDVASSLAAARASDSLVQKGGRRVTQKQRHPVIRSVLCADA